MDKISLDALREKISTFPRKELIHRPTPWRRLDRLTKELGGPEIWVKRDDLTGLAFGGNKARKLEFIIADALNKGADTIITWASVQSNWCLQTAAAARRFGLRPVLILFNTSGLPAACDGNLLLDFILGADVRIREAPKGRIVSEAQVREALDEVTGEVRASGGKPYVVSVGGSMPGWSMDKPLGAIAYSDAFVEMFDQSRSAGVAITHLVHATGSGATQAGLILGAKTAPAGVQVVGISVSEKKAEFAPVIEEICRQSEKALALDLGIASSDVIVMDEYVKGGYGIVDKETAEAVRLLFTAEGIVLDPVYTGKTMAGLVDLVRKGFFRKDDRVLFFHTGGTPALFPYREPLVRLLGGEI
jgi:D-cysteine desulfhydrase family pyridoxal phosphate-dependent enzyme